MTGVQTCALPISERSPRGASSWFNRFAETRDRLALDADNRALAPESEFVDYEIREVLFKTRKGNPYRVLFTLQGNEVLVLRVRGLGQDFVPEEQFPTQPGTK